MSIIVVSVLMMLGLAAVAVYYKCDWEEWGIDWDLRRRRKLMRQKHKAVSVELRRTLKQFDAIALDMYLRAADEAGRPCASWEPDISKNIEPQRRLGQ